MKIKPKTPLACPACKATKDIRVIIAGECTLSLPASNGKGILKNEVLVSEPITDHDHCIRLFGSNGTSRIAILLDKTRVQVVCASCDKSFTIQEEDICSVVE